MFGASEDRDLSESRSVFLSLWGLCIAVEVGEHFNDNIEVVSLS